MIIICTTLIRENTPGVFVENAFRRQLLLVFISFSHSTHRFHDDDDDSNWKMQSSAEENFFFNDWRRRRASEKERENAQHVSSFPSKNFYSFLWLSCELKSEKKNIFYKNLSKKIHGFFFNCFGIRTL